MGHWPDGNDVIANSAQEQETQSRPIFASGLAAENGVVNQLTDVPDEDTEFQRGPTGRTRRFLNVENRRMRIRARRERIAQKTTASAVKPIAVENRVDHNGVVPDDIVKLSGQISFESVSDTASLEKVLLAADPSIQTSSLYDQFDRVVVVNLDRRADRMERLERHLAEINWPFRYPQRFRAVDGKNVKPPRWWRAGAAAWGCHQSHVQIIEQAMMDDLSSILILEDDVFFEPDLRRMAEVFLSAVPDDWQQIYFGGQHLFQRRQPPIKVNEHVIRPFNVNRTHAYALHKRGFRLVYQWITDYVKHSEHPRHHVDHRLGALHGSGLIKVYAPSKWIAGQFESHSNIKGRVMPTRLWNVHRVQDQNNPFVAVIGLHRSGSSCLAGVLHKLGVHMGDKLQGYESTGGFEAVGLMRVCESAYPFPSTAIKSGRTQLLHKLRRHIRHVQRSAKSKGKIAGGKYPHLCAMGDELMSVCGQGLKVIHIDRPLEDSIASLKARSRVSKGWLKASDLACEQLQRWLWAAKQEFLSRIEHLTIQYAELLENPNREIERIIEYLKINPSLEHRQAAVEHVQPELCRHAVTSNGAQQ